MSREVRRVSVDFDWELDKVWGGYRMPEKFREDPCPDCELGYSPHAHHLRELFYGYIPFDASTTGSTRLTSATPAVRAFAERQIASAPGYYGRGEAAIVREAQRLADLWNGMWSHHLDQADVDALVAAERLMDFTHTFSREMGWVKKDPPVTPTAAEVNEWSLGGFGHDAINAGVVIDARCEREGQPVTCATCNGHAVLEAYEGQRAEAEAWEPTEPPKGDGWQLWETVSEGSPISPVFDTANGLAAWMSDPERGTRWVPFATAQQFIKVGWAPSGVGSPQTGFVPGVEAIGFWAAEKGDDA